MVSSSASLIAVLGTQSIMGPFLNILPNYMYLPLAGTRLLIPFVGGWTLAFELCTSRAHVYIKGLKRESHTMRSLRSSRSNDLASADDVVHTEEPTVLPLGVATITSTPITPDNESSADSVHLSLCAVVRASSLPTHESVDESVSGSVERPLNAKSNRKTSKASKNTKSNKNKSTTKKSAVKKEKLVRFDVSQTRCNSKSPIPASTSMLRCSLCMTWCHVECTGEDNEYVGVWSCRSCRTLWSMTSPHKWTVCSSVYSQYKPERSRSRPKFNNLKLKTANCAPSSTTRNLKIMSWPNS